VQQQKLSNWMWVNFAVSVFVAFPASAEVVEQRAGVQPGSFNSQSPITKIPQLKEIALPATTIKDWLSQSPTPDSPSQLSIQITGVQVNSTDDGINVILETAGGEALQGFTTTQGNSLIVNIPNAQLRLPESQEFRQENPVEGIAAITVQAPDANSVQVSVTGIDGIPSGKVVQTQQGLTLSLSAPEPDIELIVTAQKRSEDVQDVPISITVIPEEEIEDADINSLSDIAANTPNFSIFNPSRNFILYSIRGLSNFNFLSRDPVAFYVDDVPYDYTGFLDIDLPDIERVEVLRGPQSVLYGRNALAGAVNIITRKPTNTFEFNASASYGNYDNLDLRAGISGPLVEDNLFFRLSGKYGSRDGYLENTFLDTDVDEQSGGTGRAQVLWTPTEDWEISFNASFDDYHDGALPLVFLEQSDPYEIEQNFDGFNDLNSNTQSVRAVYNQPNFRLTSITARRSSDRDFENEADVTIQDIITQIGDDDSTIFSQEIRLQSPEDAYSFQWLLGGYFESRDFNIDADGFRYGADAVTAFGFPPGRSFVSAEINETIYAIFAQASYTPIDAVTLTAGVRYESYNGTLEDRENIFIPADGSPSSPSGASFNDVEQDGDIVLPRFVVQYRFNPNIMVYGSVARGYRPPGVNYRAEDEQELTYEAEKSWNYEVGLKSSWLDDRLNVNLAVFHNPVNDFQVPVPNPELGLFQLVTNADVSITGFEVEVKATLIDGLDVIAGFGFANAEFTDYTNPFTGENFDENQLAYAPEFTYNLAVQYRTLGGIFARLELQGLGTTYFDDANRFKQGPVAIVNARLGYELDNYGIYFFANNIFDTETLNSVVPFGSFGNLATYGAPLTYGFQLRARI
jgi:iron complex outermembrane receptor protein